MTEASFESAMSPDPPFATEEETDPQRSKPDASPLEWLSEAAPLEPWHEWPPEENLEGPTTMKDWLAAELGQPVMPASSGFPDAPEPEVEPTPAPQAGTQAHAPWAMQIAPDEGEAAGIAPADQRVDRWARALGARMRPGNQVTGLVDGPETFGSVLHAMRTATGPGHFVYLLGWWLDLDVPLAPSAQPAACARVATPAGTTSRLRSVLHSADAAGVQVRAMLWDQTGSSKNTAEVGWVNSLLHGAAILDNNQLSATFGSQHQKIIVVAGSEGLVAFCGGIDINWDRVCPSFPLFPPSGATTPGGEAEETASIAQQASGVSAESSGGSSGGGGGDPLHDVHVRLVGPAADDLLQVFVGRWYANPEHHRLDRTKGALRGLCQPPSAASGPALVRVEQTFNATFAPPQRPVLSCATPPPEGPVVRVRERGVQQIYLTAIEQARRFIYWEDQYMVHMCAAEALRRALTHVEFIILLMADSSISDLPHRWAWRKRFIEHIRRDPLGRKLHVFVLRHPATGGIGPHTYVHAKTMMVDDELSIIGSANCNRRGWESDTEVAAAIAGDADERGRLFAGRIRQRLWAEHLGVATSVVEDPVLSAPLWWLPAPGPAQTVLLAGGRTVNLSGRRVRPYDVDADTDSLSDRVKPDDWVDPPAPLPGSPCGPGGLLSVAAAQQPLVAATEVPAQAVRFAVG